MDSRIQKDIRRFADLTYEDFQRLAQDPTLSPAQRIGFPDAYRAGFEATIVADMLAKVPPLSEPGRTVLDIGCGSTDVPRLLMENSAKLGQKLLLVDSVEQLALVPDGVGPDGPAGGVEKVAGRFPALPELCERLAGKVDAIVVYSVLHYVFPGGDLFGFLDAACALLAPGGHLFLGDIPNVSKRKRFFDSATGVAYHKAFMGTEDPPVVDHFALEPGRMDDGIVFAVLMRYRQSGFDTYVLPQPRTLPMSNRREDLLIVRP